jgi:hypothetical protein
MSQLAFETFPTGEASALAILVIPVTRTKYWAHAWRKNNEKRPLIKEGQEANNISADDLAQTHQ